MASASFLKDVYKRQVSDPVVAGLAKEEMCIRDRCKAGQAACDDIR